MSTTTLLTVEQAAAELGMTGRAIRYHIAQGHIAARAIGGGPAGNAGLYLIPAAALRKFRKQFPDDRAKKGPKSNPVKG